MTHRDNMKTNNVDPHEISKFSAHASQWWDPEGDLKTLHQLNPLRLCYINSKVHLSGKKIIDVGCGGGIFAEGMASLGAKVTAIDMSEAAITVARLHLNESKVNVDYKLMTAEQLALQAPGTYDIVTCLEMLEHVPDPISTIEACAALVKPGGQVFFSTINRNLKSYLYAIIGAEYVLKLLPKSTHDYAKFIKPSELTAWCRKMGLNAKDMTGIHYDLLSKQFSLAPNDVSVNYLLHLTRSTSSQC
jgi:2-polyprenyl-6-hydroxyphenyl methylase / 3-demethylubiquinone-9 3-methyltransferase